MNRILFFALCVLISRFHGFSLKLFISRNDVGGNSKEEFHFSFPVGDDSHDSLETSVISFCEEHSLFHSDCDELMRIAYQKLQSEAAMGSSSGKRSIPNPELKATSAALDAEMRNNNNLNPDNADDVKEMLEFEKKVDDAIFEDFLSQYKKFQEKQHSGENSFSQFPLHPRVCFIHSTMVTESDSDLILREILQTISEAELLNNLVRVWVLNYGVELANWKRLLSQYPNLIVIHRSYDSFRFEIPTLRHLQHFSNRVDNYFSDVNAPLSREANSISRERKPEVQVLYLHTKGVSYEQDYAPIADWRRLITHFLVTQHSVSHHLLASGMFDTTGVNYYTSPRYYSGNMWWATARYLSERRELPWSAKKHDAEYWLLNHSPVRVYVLHSSNVNHYQEVYPPERYVQQSRDKRKRKDHTNPRQIDDGSVSGDYDPTESTDLSSLVLSQQRQHVTCVGVHFAPISG